MKVDGENGVYWFWVNLVVSTIKKSDLKKKNPKGEVWRNLKIVSAVDEKEAVAKALRLGKEDEGDSRGSLTLDGKPATTLFVGISSMGMIHEDLDDGSEILFSCYREFMNSSRRKIESPAVLRKRLKKEIGPAKRSAQRTAGGDSD